MNCVACTPPSSTPRRSPRGGRRRRRRVKAKSAVPRGPRTRPGDVIEYKIDNDGTHHIEIYAGIALAYPPAAQAEQLDYQAKPLRWDEQGGVLTVLRFHGLERPYSLTDIPDSVTIRVEGCCTQGSCASVGIGLGARTVPLTPDRFIRWQNVQNELARDYLRVCTRAMIGFNQCKTIPIPADLRGQTLDQLANSLRGIIFKVVLGPNCWVKLYIQFNLRNGGCTYLCG